MLYEIVCSATIKDMLKYSTVVMLAKSTPTVAPVVVTAWAVRLKFSCTR